MDEVDPDVEHLDEPSEAGRPTSIPFSLAAAGLVGGLVLGLVAALALGGSDTGPAPTPMTVAPIPELGEETVEAAEAFLASWERSRRATYLAVSEWHRVTDLGGELRQTRVLAQRPPDRIRRAGGSVAGTAGGVRYTCDEIDDDDVACQALPDPASEESYDDRVDREVELMWRHLEGPNPLYRVSRDDECFHLRLVRAMAAPPYGVRTTFCFDPPTGAIARFRLERAEGVDTEELVWAVAEVADDDVVAVAEGRFDPEARQG